MMRISEIGLCHDGDFNLALKLISASSKSGFTAVKFQKRSAGKWFSDPTPRPDSPFGKTVGEHRHHLEFTVGEHKTFQIEAHKLDLKYGCSVWDSIAAIEIMAILKETDFLKIGRPSNSDEGLLHTIRSEYQKKKYKFPLIVSCRNKIEVDYIKEIFQDLNDLNLVFLFCDGNYPTRLKDLPAKLPDWASGTSLHHNDPNFGSFLGGEIIERHVAFQTCHHRDKAWSIILPDNG